MAVFSNDPRAQQLWERSQMLNLITSRPCIEGKGTGQIAGLVDICGTDDKKRERLGYSRCLGNTTVTDCQDYNRNVKAKAENNAELQKYLKDTAKAKADKDKKAAELAAEQAILARRRDADKSLSDAYSRACSAGARDAQNRSVDKTCLELEKKRIATDNFGTARSNVTFDEVARELGTSKASGKKPAKLKAKAKAKAKAAAKLKKKNR